MLKITTCKLSKPLNGDEIKFLDMLIAMNADFFIMNPHSSYSFEIYVIRTILGLQSVPIMNNEDFYMRDPTKKTQYNRCP